MALADKYRFLPEYWFFGVDSLLELSFFFITAAICYYAYQAYKVTRKQNPKYFFLGFLFISTSYFVKALTSYTLHFIINKGTLSYALAPIWKFIFAWGYYIHLLLMLVGFLYLTFIALKQPNNRTKWLVVLLVLVLSLQSQMKVANYYVSSVLMLSIITYHFLSVWQKNRHNKCALIPLIGFGALVVSHLLLYVSETHILFYVVGYLLELAAYGLLLMNLLISVWYGKHGKKT